MESNEQNAKAQQQLGLNLRHNLAVNILDGAFFGLGLGFASFVTVLPLFVSTLTSSAILIGLIPAIHNMGWQLPQLLTANRVARLSRYKPMTMWMTVNERVPFLGLALVAWFLPALDRSAALLLTFALLIWQGLGGGLTATAWQSMISKIIPPRQRGTFFGSQSAAANLLASGSAVAAGLVLERLGSPFGFTVCFLGASAAMTVSWFFLNGTREPAIAPQNAPESQRDFWKGIGTILRRDRDFRWFLIARMLAQVAMIGFAFYIVYVVRQFNVDAALAGIMTGVLMATQIAANPILGWIGDRSSHRFVMQVGALAAAAGAAIAWWATDVNWFFLVLMLSGIANAALWTTSLTLTLEFGSGTERPAYIGLANTLVAPSTILAPLLGGVLADAAGYPTAFISSVAGGLLTIAILYFLVGDPRSRTGRERESGDLSPSEGRLEIKLGDSSDT